MDTLFTEKQRNNLLDTLYLAPFEASGWKTFLHQLVQCSDSRSARLLVLNNDANQVLSSIQVNTDEKAHQRYVDHFVNLCPWRPELVKKAPGYLYSTRLDFSCDQKHFYGSEFFNDWAKPLDIHHGACGTVWRHEGTTVQLLIQRTGGQGHYDKHSMRALNALLPHMRRTLRIEALQHRQHMPTQLGLPHDYAAMILLNACGKVVYVSEGAEGYVDNSGPLSVRDGVLRLCRGQQKLRDAISRVLERHQVDAGSVIDVAWPGKPGLRLLVMRIHPDGSDNVVFPIRACAAIFIIDIQPEVHIDQIRLTQLFGLTPMESRTASAIARGMNPAEAASDFGVSVCTVRSHLKNVFRKTATTTQSQLSYLILNSPAAQRSLS